MAVTISATSNKPELLAALRSIDISVPLRTEGRTTHHAETWAICRLLSTLAHSERLAFPMSLSHRDRPDFVLTSGAIEIGIEVTEAISEQYAAYSALGEREFPDALLEPAHFRWGAPKLSVEDMRNLLRQTQLSGAPWVGDRPEQEWALFIQSAVDVKLQKLANPQFQKFDRDCLSIYDNLPLPPINLEKGIKFLRPLLEERWSRSPSFDTVYIEHGRVVVEISAAVSSNFSSSGRESAWVVCLSRRRCPCGVARAAQQGVKRQQNRRNTRSR